MANAAVERFGSLDVLVCNAGISQLKPFEAITINEGREVLTADLDTCFLGAQAALPFLKGSRGNIVNVASASGLGGDRQLTAYNAAKGAVVNFTRVPRLQTAGDCLGVFVDLDADDLAVSELDDVHPVIVVG